MRGQDTGAGQALSVVETSPVPALPAQKSTANLVLAILALAVGGFGIGTTEFAIMGLLPFMVADLGVDIPAGGHVISAYALGVVVGAPLLSTLGARLPHKRVALALMLLFTLGNLSSYIATDYGWLLLSRFISGLPHGAFFGVAAVIAASLSAPTRRARAVAMVMMGLSVANVVGVPFATWLGQQFGWRTMFLLVGLIGILTLGMITRFVPHQDVRDGASITGELGALKRGQVWMTLLIGTVGFGGFFAVYTYIAPTMTEVAGVSENLLPVVVALYGLGMVAGNIVGGRLADISVLGTIYWVMGSISVCLLVFAFAVQWAPTALLFVFLVGAIGSSLIPSLQVRLMDVSPDAPSLASSMNHAALNTANALGAFLGGAVIAFGWGYTAPALVGAVLAAFGLGVALLSGRMDRNRPSVDPVPVPAAR
ncbi:MFS transporter, DHA1 family, arabinose polymer transporter [Arthrobacter subterraneus]|uniref:MFS transporter, DHA1 family, arabinose polymer transporter n=1 Tax=Arthrobacter subterraneus TaxID=335973 RepID=A0A1G8GA93_9MICC|nr:MFS transporter [Arthrobacter subterraneus]SDH91295.1 MFS transporter, DHA1 family, arabinose polymer transporter [Arthrobacter subterraneus]